MGQGPILVVEDDPSMRSVLVDALEGEGYPAVAVTNGADGIAAVGLTEPRLVLLDLETPVDAADGVVDVLRQRRRDVPVIIMSGSRDVWAVAEQIGAAGYCPKPFELDDLLAVIATVAGPVPPAYLGDDLGAAAL